jgi:hypothetical protein
VEDKPAGPGKQDEGKPAVHDLPLEKKGGKAPGGINRRESQKMDQPPAPRQELPACSHSLKPQQSEISKYDAIKKLISTKHFPTCYYNNTLLGKIISS